VKKSEGVMMREKSTKLLLSCAALLFICMLACVVGVASAKTIYVPDNYEKIQWAVDNATAGDTIIVRDGIYYENVNVYKQLTLKSENGSANCIILAANSIDHALEITANYVNISGLTVTGANGEGILAGIYLNNANYCNISNNNIYGNSNGIYIYNSNYNNLVDNTVLHSDGGIGILYSQYNIISNNKISDNTFGIYLHNSSYNNHRKRNKLE